MNLQTSFPCLAGFFSLWQSDEFVNALRLAFSGKSHFFEFFNSGRSLLTLF